MKYRNLGDTPISETSDNEYSSIFHSSSCKLLKQKISRAVCPSCLRETRDATDTSKCNSTSKSPTVQEFICNIDKYKLPSIPADYSCIEKYAIHYPPHIFWRNNDFNFERLLPADNENDSDYTSQASIILDKYVIPTSIFSKGASHLVQIYKYYRADLLLPDNDDVSTDIKIKPPSTSQSSSAHGVWCKSRACVLDLTEKYAFNQTELDKCVTISDSTKSASGCPVIYSPSASTAMLKHIANAKKKPKKRRVMFKLPHTVFGEEPKVIPTPESEPEPEPEDEHQRPHKLPCPHTGCTRLVSLKAGRLTAHFRHHHYSISRRLIIRKREEYFILDVPKQLFNCNCFSIMKMRFIENLPEFTLFLMLTRFNELVKYKQRCRVLIWVLTDEKVIPVNITILYENEMVECRARTLGDKPDITNCLDLSRKVVKKFNRNNGGCVTLKVL